MAVQCAHCGEELLGSVNRCWRCGHSMIAHAGPADVPPVRRAPISEPLDAPVAALVMADAVISESMPGPKRKGSPFATMQSNTAEVQSSPIRLLAPVVSRRAANIAPTVAGSISILMGIIALAVAYLFSPGALVIALAGIGFGIWGLYSHKRVPGSIGLVVCCLALSISAFLLTIEIWQYMYGSNPFAAPVPPASAPF